MIHLISDPSELIQVSPAVYSRWLATESPNIFRMQRRDYDLDPASITGTGAIGGTYWGFYISVTYPAGVEGAMDDQIAIHDNITDAMLIGYISDSMGDWPDVYLAVPALAYNPAWSFDYLNDNTLHPGYYIEGRLTINGVLHPLSIYAYPDTFGFVDLDVSGILRIMTTMEKTGAYSIADPIAKEPTKSGKFTLEYRECWYGSDEAWQQEGHTWYYGEVVRSEEQGSNLHEFVPDITDAPFLNLFEKPVYTVGYPFDLSFILPDTIASPEADLTVTIRNYNRSGTPGTVHTYTVPSTVLVGFINSLTIDQTMVDVDTAYLTAEIA
jgi:hypothetical protein